MPFKSEKQRKFLKAVEHDPKFAKKVGVSQDVAREFSAAEELKKIHKTPRVPKMKQKK